MNPNKSCIIEDEIKPPNILAICHTGTQTNKDSPKNSYHSTKSKDICADTSGSSDKVSVKYFEFSQIVQDTDNPENVTIIKDSFSEEIRQHSSTSQDATANRYKYCREVIKPFLKDYPESSPVSDEDLIKDVLESVQKDFPDYKPCFETKSSSNTDSCYSDSKLEKPKHTHKERKDHDVNPPFLCCEKIHSGAQPANASSGGNVFIPVRACENSESKQKGKKDKDTPDSTTSFTSCSNKSGDISEDLCNMDKKKSSTTKEPPQDEYDDPYDPCRKPKCPQKSICPEEIKPCKKPKHEPKQPPPPFCTDDTGPKCFRKLTTGCENDKELREQAKRAKQACKDSGSSVQLPPVTKPPPQKTVMQAHCEALETLKAVASSAMCKVCKATKDTVSLIRTESAKQFEKLKAFSSECEDTCDDSSNKEAKKKSSKDTGVTEVTNILGTKNIMENLEQLQKVDPEDILQRMVEKMESTVSMISENFDFDSFANILKSNDTSSNERPRSPPRDFVHNLSREDVHAAEEPKEIKPDITNTANTMFMAIKSKIFSIFSDINKGVENPESSDEDN